MFFVASKLVWFVLQPLVLIMALLAFGLLFGAIGWRRVGFALTVLALVSLAVAALSPLGLVMTAALESRFPRPVLPANVAGIVVLGGSFDTRVARTRGFAELNEAADRVTAAMALSRLYPQAKVIFSGGLAGLVEEDVPEIESAREFFAAQGLAADRLLLEGRARNTTENAVFSKELADPKPGETWLLVTSASHMPRAVGCFRVAGFDVLPFPVDYRTPSGSLVWHPSTSTNRNLEKLHFALREYIGLAAYYVSGKTDALFPAPSSSPATGAPACRCL